MPQIIGVHINTQKQVSSDTVPFVFKATTIDPATDAVGTFNTYLYNINSNTVVIQTSAPTQTTSSMNVNGVQVFARAYNAAGTTGQPNRVEIFIGKGLKSKQVDSYGAAAKLSPATTDYVLNGNTEIGTRSIYSEVTGILQIDCASANSSTNIAKYIGSDSSTSTVYSSGYFVFNASKF